MTSPPYTQPGGAEAFWAVLGLFVLGEWIMRVRSRLNRRGVTTERWSVVVVIVGVVVGVLAAFRLASVPPTEITTGRWPLFGVGLALMVAGTLLRQWAIVVLGPFFTADVRVHADQPVVDSGPYRWVRHPSYSGLVGVFVGLGLALSDWASLLVLAVVPTAVLVVRIHAEERALLAALGEDYRRFAAGRARLVPGLW